jgi:transcriptional regulator with XRE-family HTH domain
MKERKIRIRRTEYSPFKHLCDRYRLDYLWDEKDKSGRQKRGITITEMAEKLGFIGKNGKGQESKLSQYENASKGPPLDIVMKYLDFFKLNSTDKYELLYAALESSARIILEPDMIKGIKRETFLKLLAGILITERPHPEGHAMKEKEILDLEKTIELLFPR